MSIRRILPLGAALTATSIAVAGPPLHIMPIGDSITQGGRAGAKEYTYRWPLARMLRDEGACFDFIGTRHAGLDATAHWPANWNDSHEGYYGAHTATVRDRLAEHLPLLPPPDLALVHLGTNDQNGGQVDEDIIAPMRDIVALLRRANPRVTVLIAQIPVRTLRGMYLHYRMDRLADALNEASSHVATVDQFSGWNARDDTSDGVHPNLMGQRWMAERWLAAMRPFIDATCDDRGQGTVIDGMPDD